MSIQNISEVETPARGYRVVRYRHFISIQARDQHGYYKSVVRENLDGMRVLCAAITAELGDEKCG